MAIYQLFSTQRYLLVVQELLISNLNSNEVITAGSNCLCANSKFFENLDRSEFQNLLSLSVKNYHFVFNGCLY